MEIIFFFFLNLIRVLGFPAIYTSSCDNATDIRVINFNEDLDLDHYLNPIALIICYLVVTLTSIILLDPQVIWSFEMLAKNIAKQIVQCILITNHCVKSYFKTKHFYPISPIIACHSHYLAKLD